MGRFSFDIRRNHLAEDAFSQLYPLGSQLRGLIRITLFDANGLPEAGIDGGGVFKEFLTE
jgi:ubiquitin-protein ligase E3 C